MTSIGRKELMEAMTIMEDMYADLYCYREIDRLVNEILQNEIMSDQAKVEAIKTVRKCAGE